MRYIDNRDVNEAVTEMVRVLGPHDAEDWSVPAGPLEWSCWTTAAHIAHDLLAYAGQIAARPTDAYLPFDLSVRSDSSPREVLQVVTACAGLLGSALATASPEVRAWHWGPCDPSGFAAMGVAEVLLHTHDITQGLGVPWLPRRRSVRQCSTGSSLMPHPVTRLMSSSGAPAGATWTAIPAATHGHGRRRWPSDQTYRGQTEGRPKRGEPSRSQH